MQQTSAMDAYLAAQTSVKTAASGERPHDMLPGRTSTTKRAKGATTRPKNVRPPAPKVPSAPMSSDPPAKKPKEEVEPKVEATAATGPGGPKLDLKFSIKLGAVEALRKFAEDSECSTPGEKIRSKGKGRGKARGKGKGPIGEPSAREVLRKMSEQGNTGARVDGTFNPSTNAGGGYGTSVLGEERSPMQTPALPDGTEDGGGYVGDVKVSTIVDGVMRKLAGPQPEVPQPDGPEPPRSQPAGTPVTPQASNETPIGETAGVLGGTAAGMGLGALFSRRAQLAGPRALVPVVGGAVAGAGLGGLAGHKIEKAVRQPEATDDVGEEELQQLLQTMQQQNPQFYRRMAEDKVKENV